MKSIRSIIYTVIAIFCYSSAGVIIEQELNKMKYINILIVEFGITFVLAIIYRKICMIKDSANIEEYAFPTDTKILVIFLILGIIVFFGNILFTKALLSGTSVVVINSLMILMPVATFLILSFWVRETPNIYCITGYVLAVLAILFMAKGTMK